MTTTLAGLTAIFTSCSFLIDVGVGVFFVAAAVQSLSVSVGLTPVTYPHFIVCAALVVVGALIVISGLCRFTFTDVYMRCLHRFSGKALVFAVASAFVISLEPPNAILSWRGICAVITTVIAIMYVCASFATGRKAHPRPLIFCGEKVDSPRAAPTPFAALSPGSATTAGSAAPFGRPPPAQKKPNPFIDKPVASSWPDA
jgi:hypothetical protein